MDVLIYLLSWVSGVIALIGKSLPRYLQKTLSEASLTSLIDAIISYRNSLRSASSDIEFETFFSRNLFQYRIILEQCTVHVSTFRCLIVPSGTQAELVYGQFYVYRTTWMRAYVHHNYLTLQTKNYPTQTEVNSCERFWSSYVEEHCFCLRHGPYHWLCCSVYPSVVHSYPVHGRGFFGTMRGATTHAVLVEGCTNPNFISWLTSFLGNSCSSGGYRREFNTDWYSVFFQSNH